MLPGYMFSAMTVRGNVELAARGRKDLKIA
jgi:hypothetical protein